MSGDDFSRDVDEFPFGRSDIFRISDHHDFFRSDVEETFLSYSDYLNGSVDYGQVVDASSWSADNNRALGASGSGGGCKSGGTTTPLTPNSSASSSSTEDVDKQVQEQPHAKEEVEDGDHDKSNKKVSKPRKKGEKRKREARFAFMTKSEVDHLEDGYRWRKYGQKAVKNSPYPRSYYRCTTQKCGVKKRVERSFQDPTVVITTYEGQHTHQSPATVVRGSSHFLARPAPPPASFAHQEQLMHHHELPQVLINNMFLPSPLRQQLQLPDYGLLQDIVPSFNANQP